MMRLGTAIRESQMVREMKLRAPISLIPVIAPWPPIRPVRKTTARPAATACTLPPPPPIIYLPPPARALLPAPGPRGLVILERKPRLADQRPNALRYLGDLAKRLPSDQRAALEAAGLLMLEAAAAFLLGNGENHRLLAEAGAAFNIEIRRIGRLLAGHKRRRMEN
jgi:hypothetical protein